MNKQISSFPKSEVSINDKYTTIDGFNQAAISANKSIVFKKLKTNFESTNAFRYLQVPRQRTIDLFPLDFNSNNYTKINEKTEVYTVASVLFNGAFYYIGFVFEKKAEHICNCDKCGGSGISPADNQLCGVCGGTGHLIYCNLVATKPSFYVEEIYDLKSGAKSRRFKKAKLKLTENKVKRFIETVSTFINVSNF